MLTAKTRATKKLLQTLTKKCSRTPSVSNVYGPTSVREWYRLQWGDSQYDLTPSAEGQMPEWKAREIEWEDSQLGKSEAERQPPPPPVDWWPWWMDDGPDLHDVLGVSVRSPRVMEFGQEWSEPWRHWALTHGIAPGQLFCVEYDEPEVSKSGYEVVEYDIHWAGAVVEVIPIPPAVAARRWEHDRRRTAVARAQYEAMAHANADLLQRDVASMYLRCDFYIAGWDTPRGVLYELQSKRHLHPRGQSCIGTQGRSDKGDREEAMKDLIEQVCASNPYLSPALVKALPVRR